MGSSKFVISLDFELHWGVFDTLGNGYHDNLVGTRSAIYEMLALFKEHDISATWATVGLLFNECVEDYENYKPNKMPTYHNAKLNPYDLAIGVNEFSDEIHYAHNVIEKILSTPKQEVATHSYSHYYANEEGQNKEQFEEDIKSAIKIAKDKFDIELKSYVFPKNEVNFEYLDVLKKHGILFCRVNPKNRIYLKGQKVSFIDRAIRLLDSYVNITGNHNSSVVKDDLFLCQGDRFLRPYKNSLLAKLMLSRVKKEMLAAAMNNRVYHLWWHPHNFGINTQENLSILKDILVYYHYLKRSYGMSSIAMCEILNHK